MRYFLAALVFVSGMFAQWWWSTYFSFWGVAPQILLVLTVAISSCSGPVAGVCFGFAWGLFLDVLGVHLFGSNALALTLTAYLVGFGKRQMDVSSPVSQIVVTAMVTAGYFLFLSVVGLVFQHRAYWVGWPSLLFDPLLNCLVTPVAFVVVDRTLEF